MPSPRRADHPVDPLFLERWSPRAFTGEIIPVADLLTILEAARWAPSSSNAQPWRDLWARRGTAAWGGVLGLLNELNRSWAHAASALVVIVSRTVMDRPDGTTAPAPTHSFDAGAGWAQPALQAARSGWAAHGMVGFDRDRARAELRVPDAFSVEAVIAVGRTGDPSLLPEGLRGQEAPSGRLPMAGIAFEGEFRA